MTGQVKTFIGGIILIVQRGIIAVNSPYINILGSPVFAVDPHRDIVIDFFLGLVAEIEGRVDPADPLCGAVKRYCVGIFF